MSGVQHVDVPLPAGGVEITARDLGKRFGGVSALRETTLDIPAGEFLTLLGPSGSGKTTLLMILAGFTRPDNGELYFGDQPVHRLPPHKRNVGMVFQNYALFSHMTVAENIAYPLRIRGVGRADCEKQVAEVLSLVHLEGFEDRQIRQLSGGQAQRVALARATVFRPKILLMDEPLSALDKKLRDQMQVEIRRIHNALGVTTIYVTHDQREALTMSDRIAVLNRGAIQQLGTPNEIYTSPKTAFVADFIGGSNILPLTRSGGVVKFADQEIHACNQPPDAEALYLVARPEKLSFASAGHPASDANRFSGIVSNISFEGDSYAVSAALTNGREVTVRCATTIRDLPKPGEIVTLELARQDALIVRGDT